MKIEKLRFSNLNSLSGTWEIDFTIPQIQQSGLLAICGPTGSGKSTILDAICLALYGRTPRLNNINAKHNEIMSRHFSSCSAELIFEAQGQRYLAFFSQHRAGKKATGKLQKIVRKFSLYPNGTLLGESITEVDNLVIEKTGLDFQSFTKSIMLAQGAFAAFLEAAPDERSPLLEEITGTEIYSLISQKAHQKKNFWAEELKHKNELLTNFQILTDDELAQLESEAQALKIKNDSFDKELNELRQKEESLKQFLISAEKYKNLKEEQTVLSAREKEFEPQKKLWQRFQQALKIKPQFEKLIELDRRFITLRHAIDESEKKLSALQETKEAAQNNFLLAQKRLDEIKQNEEKNRPVILAASKLDFILSEAAKAIGGLKKQKKEIDDKIGAAQQEEKKLQAQLRQKQEEKAALNKWQEEHAHYQAIYENQQNFIKEIEFLTEQISELQKQKKLRDLAFNNKKNLGGKFLQQKNLMKLLALDIEKRKKEKNTIKDDYLLLSQNRTFSDWQQTLTELDKSLNELKITKENYQKFIDLNKQFTCLTDEAKSLETDLSLMDKEQTGKLTQKARQKEEVQHLKRLDQWNREIKSLELRRQALVAQAPCPLCGSTHHPYAENSPPADDQATIKLKDAESSLDQLVESLNKLATQIAVKHNSLEQNIKNQEIKEKEIMVLSASLNEPLKKSNLTLQTEENLLQELEKQINSAQLEKEQIEQLLKKLTEKEKILNKLEEETQQILADKASVDLKVKDLENEWQNEIKICRLRTEETLECLKKIKERKNDLNKTLLLNKLEPLLLQDLKGQNIKLLTLSGQWQEKSVQKEILEKILTDISLKLYELTTELKRSMKETEDLGLNIKNKEDDETKQKQERQNLLGGQSVHSWEMTALAQKKEAETKWQQQKEQEQKEQEQFQQCQMQLANQRKNYQELAIEKSKVELIFQECLTEQGFRDEQAFKNALVSEEQNELWQNEDQQINKLKTEQAALEKNILNDLAKIEKPKEEASDLQKNILCLSQISKENERNRGALAEKITNENKKREEQKKALAEIKKIDESYQTWAELDALIGSHDGKKFRSFAQSLTFELVLSKANCELEKLSDRYLLLPDSDNPLDIQVLDKYQGAEKRPAKTLSGGESFLVSLALALGLSAMFSEKIKLDALFLDEGFGTLDDDSLDSALAALSTLQNDGKLIVLISHVPSIKERINAKINIERQSAGIAKLSGPGVSKIHTA